MEATLLTFRGIFRIQVEIRQSFVMLAGMIILFSVVQGGSPVTAAIFIAILAASIYLHELGHAWGAKVQGLDVRRIVLHGGGGFCQHARSSNAQDGLIVPMGPLVNLAIWAICGLLQGWLYRTALADPSWVPFALVAVSWLGFASMLNLALFFYNMISVQPLDGGKILQLILLRFLPPGRAMRVTGMIGVVFCILWFPAMIWVFITYGWLLLFIPSLPLHLAMARGQYRF